MSDTLLMANITALQPVGGSRQIVDGAINDYLAVGQALTTVVKESAVADKQVAIALLVSAVNKCRTLLVIVLV